MPTLFNITLHHLFISLNFSSSGKTSDLDDFKIIIYWPFKSRHSNLHFHTGEMVLIKYLLFIHTSIKVWQKCSEKMSYF